MMQCPATPTVLRQEASYTSFWCMYTRVCLDFELIFYTAIMLTSILHNKVVDHHNLVAAITIKMLVAILMKKLHLVLCMFILHGQLMAFAGEVSCRIYVLL